MDVLISIKPKYVKSIVSGEKKVEYRKRLFKHLPCRIYIYESSPVKRIIGYFEYAGYYSGVPDEVWKISCEYAGVDYDTFSNYFADAELAYALKIDKLVIFSKPVSPESIFDEFKAPQSFFYVREGIEREKLRSLV